MSLKTPYDCNYPGCHSQATFKVSTQFSGTLYFCHKHLQPEDFEVATLYVDQLSEPMNKTLEYYYYAAAPGDYTCTINDPHGNTWTGSGTTKIEARLSAEASMSPPTSDPLKEHLEDALKYGSSLPQSKIQYLLDKLQEEAAEIIQAVSKIRRFGPHNNHPDRTTSNLQELTGELEDFQAIVWALEDIQYLDPKPSRARTIKKFNEL